MHIEPGMISAAKLAYANVSALALLGFYGRTLLLSPALLLRTAIAALFFSLFMQSFHLPVGPSELHFIGAMTLYLTLGFVPTLCGFGAGLLLQGLLFEPHDLPHLAVNSLSLIMPLIGVHAARSRFAMNRLNWQTVLKLDAMYYSGVAGMVAFWLSMSDASTSVAAWASWASSYLAIVIIEPLLTLATVAVLTHYRDRPIVARCFDTQHLNGATS